MELVDTPLSERALQLSSISTQIENIRCISIMVVIVFYNGSNSVLLYNGSNSVSVSKSSNQTVRSCQNIMDISSSEPFELNIYS